MTSIRATLAALCLFLSTSQALYFFLDGTTPKCFYEELPKDTLVVGSYKAESYNANSNSFYTTPDLAVQVTVEETFDNDHKVVSQISQSSEVASRLTFTAADSGLHKICFTPSGPGAVSLGGWFSGSDSAPGGVKITLDLVIGENSKIESDDKGKIDSIVGRIQELNSRLADVRREQIFQREREALFRDQSETTNAKIVRWTLIQLTVLGITCAWQLSHLRAFFIKQKLT